jgi:hypothetical protein
MINTICNTILSIINTGDKSFIDKKLKLLESQLTLNEVEKQIIKDITGSLYLDTAMTVSFIREKYSYYTENDSNIIESYLSKDSIDSAITDIRLDQLKTGLSKELLTLAGQVKQSSPEEIKDKLAQLHSNAIVENKTEAPENDFRKKDDPYADLVSLRDGMSLLIPRIEEHAGKATKGSMISILASTGHYKSTYALNVAYQNAMLGFNVLYLILEDTGIKIADRLVLNHIASTAKKREDLIDSTWVRDDKLSKQQKKFYNDAHNSLADKIGKHLILWDQTKIVYDTFADMTNTLRLADKQFMATTGKGLDAVFVDHVSLLKYKADSSKRATYDGAVINDWVSYFNVQALNFLDDSRQITVFILSQVSRDSFAEASKDKKLGRYDVDCPSDAHEIERTSTTMITLFKDRGTKNTLLINIPKARQGYTTDNPFQVEAYGEYYHIGSLNNFINEGITAGDFDNPEIDLASLINADPGK